MNELRQHKRSDKIKWAITFTAIILMAILIVGLCLQLFAADKYKPAEWFKKPEQDENANAVISNGESNGIMLASARLLNSQYEENGISPQADSAYTLTATLESDVMEDLNTNVTWSIYWKNSSSTWASGKTVTDYVTLANSGLTATVTCKQAFGEPVMVKVVPQDNDSVNATCQIDYISRITKITNPDSSNLYVFPSETSSVPHPSSVEYTVEFGTGTIMGEIYIDSYVMEPNDVMQSIFSNSKLTQGASSMGFSGSATLKNATYTRNAVLTLQPDKTVIVFVSPVTRDFLQINGGGNCDPVYRNLNNLFVDYSKSPVAYFFMTPTFSLRYNGEKLQTYTANHLGLKFDSMYITKVAQVKGVTLDNTSLAF